MNVILFTLDCVRADHVACYGYEKIRTPNIDRLAENGEIFFTTIVEDPVTDASHRSIMTSLYPHHHRNVFSKNGPANSLESTLAEILSRNGYATAAFVSSFVLKGEVFRLNRGFEVYEDDHMIISPRRIRREPPWWPGEGRPPASERPGVMQEGGKLNPGVPGPDRRADRTTELAIRWLNRNFNRNFFLWIHYIDPHAPYAPTAPYDKMYDPDYKGDWVMSKVFMEGSISDRDLEHVIALYDGEITYVDENLGRLIGEVESLGLVDETLVIITADHGELFSEHGLFSHGVYLYEPLLRVPLIMRCPRCIPSGKVIEGLVQTIDIMPTILDVLKIPLPEWIDGLSLMPLVKEELTEIRSEVYSEKAHLKSIRTKKWKLILSTMPNQERMELYDLEDDPQELRDLYKEKKEIAETLKKKLLNWMAK